MPKSAQREVAKKQKAVKKTKGKWLQLAYKVLKTISQGTRADIYLEVFLTKTVIDALCRFR